MVAFRFTARALQDHGADLRPKPCTICSEIKATDTDINTTWLSYANVRDLDGITRSVQEFQPNVILNLAALTDLSPTGC